jgi:hypothetical protein
MIDIILFVCVKITGITIVTDITIAIKWCEDFISVHLQIIE